MKLSKLVRGACLGAAVLAAGAFAALPLVARAQTATPTAPQNGAPAAGPHKGFGLEGGSSVMDLINATALQTGLKGPQVLTQLQSGQTLTQIAESKGKTAADVIKAGRALLQDRLNLNVKVGWLTQAQADAELAQFDQSAPQLMTAVNLGGGKGFDRGNGFGFGGGRGPRGHGGMMGGDEGLLSATASVTGLTLQEVMTQLQAGQSLTQIAQSKGKTADEVIKAARAAEEAQLKQAVTAGQLTQAQADAHLAQFDQTAPQIMTATGLGQHFHQGPRFAPNTAPTPAPSSPSTNTSFTW